MAPAYSHCICYWILLPTIGAKEAVDRWEMCIQTTKRFFGLALGALYSKNNAALKETRYGVRLFVLFLFRIVILRTAAIGEDHILSFCARR